MKSITARFLTVALIGLLFSACDRAPSDVSRVSLQLPTYSSSGVSSKTGVDALACSPCLKNIIVNVNGSDFKTITYNQQHADLEEIGTQLSGEIVLEVPAGPGREIQILALYKNSSSSGGVTLQYGSTVVDLLSAEPPPVVMRLTNLGVFKGGSVQGRYLTGVDSGPTGRVQMELNYKGIQMQMFTGDILNGWFSFFVAHEEFPLTYRVAETGQVLFSGLTTESIKNGATKRASDGVSQQVLHFTRSGPYYVDEPAENTRRLETETHDLVYGYFSDDPALISAKRVCIEASSGDSSLSHVFSGPSSGDASYTYSNSSPTAKFYGTGGTSSNDSYCISSMSGVRSFEADKIVVRKSQMDGQGNDHARAIAGAFSYWVSSDGSVARYEKGDTPLEFKLKSLPGLYTGGGALFNGILLYKKANAGNGGYDDPRCDEKWLDSRGFTKVEGAGFSSAPTLFVTTGDGSTVKFTLNTPQNATDGYVVCPTKSGTLTGLGGMYLGALGPTPQANLTVALVSGDATLSGDDVDFGTKSSSSTSTAYVRIRNNGSIPITNLNGYFYGGGSKFQFYSGGGFPGVDGTCQTSGLAVWGECDIKVSFIPAVAGSFDGTLRIQYDDGSGYGVRERVIPLTGTGY